MSNSGIPVVEDVAKEGKRAFRKVKDDIAPDLGPKVPGEDGASGAGQGKGPADKSIEARAEQFATRKQALGRNAAAAGATRSDNDADILGYTVPRRRSATRDILG